MLPTFLDEFKEEIEKYKQETVRIVATPVTNALPLKQSKFLGTPFLPIGVEYPKDSKGIPMIMLAQINFAEMPALEDYPVSGILQLFVSPDDWFDMSESQILYHERMDGEVQTDFSFITKALYDQSPINCEHQLVFNKEVEYGGTEDFRFDLEFNGQDYYEYKESLPPQKQEELDNVFYNIGHKIGGYAYFTQIDPRLEDETKADDVLLLQIDTDDEIMFGDSGVANLFINKEALKNRDFSKAYFNWDCC